MKVPVPRHIEKAIPYNRSRQRVEGEAFRGKRVRLSANENPLGPSPKAAEAIKNYLSQLHKYPDAAVQDLRETLAVRLGWPSEGIICGNGSDEIMGLAVQTFLRRGEEGIFAWPSFVIYRILVDLAGGVPVAIPLQDYRVDTEAILDRLSDRTRIVFLASPNNPTGLVLSRDELDRLMEGIPESVLVILDEAYIQFASGDERPNAVRYVERFPNLLVLRSFSKYFGLAGLRVGFGFGHPELIGYLDRVRMPYNVNALAQVGALAALTDRGHRERTGLVVSRGMTYLYEELTRLEIPFLRSEANFVMIDVGRDGKEVADELARAGVEVRPLGDYDLTQHLRVSVGLDRENQIFIEALTKALSG